MPCRFGRALCTRRKDRSRALPMTGRRARFLSTGARLRRGYLYSVRRQPQRRGRTEGIGREEVRERTRSRQARTSRRSMERFLAGYSTAFSHRDYLVRSDCVDRFYDAAWPRNLETIRLRGLFQSKVDAQIVLPLIA